MHLAVDKPAIKLTTCTFAGSLNCQNPASLRLFDRTTSTRPVYRSERSNRVSFQGREKTKNMYEGTISEMHAKMMKNVSIVKLARNKKNLFCIEIRKEKTRCTVVLETGNRK